MPSGYPTLSVEVIARFPVFAELMYDFEGFGVFEELVFREAIADTLNTDSEDVEFVAATRVTRRLGMVESLQLHRFDLEFSVQFVVPSVGANLVDSTYHNLSEILLHAFEDGTFASTLQSIAQEDGLPLLAEAEVTNMALGNLTVVSIGTPQPSTLPTESLHRTGGRSQRLSDGAVIGLAFGITGLILLIAGGVYARRQRFTASNLPHVRHTYATGDVRRYDSEHLQWYDVYINMNSEFTGRSAEESARDPRGFATRIIESVYRSLSSSHSTNSGPSDDFDRGHIVIGKKPSLSDEDKQDTFQDRAASALAADSPAIGTALPHSNTWGEVL
jgi:hypothetical protein